MFQGIPGINMDLRLQSYYRVNYIPTFIAERTPSENREDLWELMGSVGLDYYDRFEWLLRTKMRSGNDNLIVERRRSEAVIAQVLDSGVLNLQYGDKIIVDSMDSLADTTTGLTDRMFNIILNGVDVVTHEGDVIVDRNTRAVMVPYMITVRFLSWREHMEKQRAGIERAKENGKYAGRKPIEVDKVILRQVAKEMEEGLITVEEAMKRTNIGSRSTFYRKLKIVDKI